MLSRGMNFQTISVRISIVGINNHYLYHYVVPVKTGHNNNMPMCFRQNNPESFIYQVRDQHLTDLILQRRVDQ